MSRGPEVRRLGRYLEGARASQIRDDADEWMTAQRMLLDTARSLRTAKPTVRDGFGTRSLTGERIAEGFETTAKAMRRKARLIGAGQQALRDVADTISDAKTAYALMTDFGDKPPVYQEPPPREGQQPTPEDIANNAEERRLNGQARDAWQTRYDDQETEATAWIRALDKAFREAVEPMRAIHGDTLPESPTPPGGRPGGGTPPAPPVSPPPVSPPPVSPPPITEPPKPPPPISPPPISQPPEPVPPPPITQPPAPPTLPDPSHPGPLPPGPQLPPPSPYDPSPYDPSPYVPPPAPGPPDGGLPDGPDRPAPIAPPRDVIGVPEAPQPTPPGTPPGPPVTTPPTPAPPVAGPPTPPGAPPPISAPPISPPPIGAPPITAGPPAAPGLPGRPGTPVPRGIGSSPRVGAPGSIGTATPPGARPHAARPGVMAARPTTPGASRSGASRPGAAAVAGGRQPGRGRMTPLQAGSAGGRSTPARKDEHPADQASMEFEQDWLGEEDASPGLLD